MFFACCITFTSPLWFSGVFVPGLKEHPFLDLREVCVSESVKGNISSMILFVDHGPTVTPFFIHPPRFPTSSPFLQASSFNSRCFAHAGSYCKFKINGVNCYYDFGAGQHMCMWQMEFPVLASTVKAQVIGPDADLRIVNGFIHPDGWHRVAVLAEGTFPGPVINGTKGDKFSIRVINDLTDPSMPTSTSVHWHGLHVKKYNWADGVAYVTQCPITPGRALNQTFDAGDQAGTFWYHSHFTTQYCDGLRGPLIIYDPDDPHQKLYDVDNASTIITLADWYHEPFRSGISEFNSTLINGLGRYKGGPQSPLAVVTVEYGKRYRLRFISMSCDPYFTVSIDEHELTIIEADAVNTEPLTVDSFEIFAGQRYSAILDANKPADNYWIRVTPPNTSESDARSGFDGGINLAVLRYRGAPEKEPNPSPPRKPTRMLREWDLHPLKKVPVPDADIYINMNFSKDPDTGLYLMNGYPFMAPGEPVLLQILQSISNGLATDIANLVPKETIYYVPLNKTIQLSMPISKDLGGTPHPMHLHGHKFTVIRSAGNQSLQLDNPIQRDVVDTGYAGDNVTIRWMTDNPGPWMFHCHIDDHLDRGMAIIFAPQDLRSVVEGNTPVPDDWKRLCFLKDQFQLGDGQDSMMHQ